MESNNIKISVKTLCVFFTASLCTAFPNFNTPISALQPPDFCFALERKTMLKLLILFTNLVVWCENKAVLSYYTDKEGKVSCKGKCESVMLFSTIVLTTFQKEFCQMMKSLRASERTIMTMKGGWSLHEQRP